MDFADDAALGAVLTRFDVTPDAVLGHGGEARVYALDDARVLRVLHSGGRAEDVHRRQALVDELCRSGPTFALPELIDVGEVAGRVYAIERRRPGRSVFDELAHAEGAPRARVIEAYLDATAALGDLHLEPRTGFGELSGDEPIITSTWRGYLERRAAVNLAASLPEFRSVDGVALAAALPDAEASAFVHFDAFTGNMLTDGTRITAVIDFGPTAVAGDRRLDPLSAVVYLASPDITPVATPADLDVAMSWLRAAGLDGWLEPARRWLAAFWTFAVDDPNVLGFCRSVLVPRA